MQEKAVQWVVIIYLKHHLKACKKCLNQALKVQKMQEKAVQWVVIIYLKHRLKACKKSQNLQAKQL